MPPMTGRVIAGRYALSTPIGRGAMGVVWRARDQLLDREVAVKEVVLSAAIGEDERRNAYQRTLREARTAARLSHRGVVTVFDVAEEDGRPWIVMELVPSRSLDEILTVEGPMTPLRSGRMGQQLLAALATAHAAGVLHRDVKPSNVLIAPDRSGGGWDERAVLTDFGIAQFEGDPRLTQTGMVMGSPGFTAPERIRGGVATPASDLWSLGATIYTAIEGRGPYEQRGGAITTMTAIINEDAPVAPSAGRLGPLIAALLRRDPSARPSALAAARMFNDVLPLLPDVPSHPATVRSAYVPPSAAPGAPAASVMRADAAEGASEAGDAADSAKAAAVDAAAVGAAVAVGAAGAVNAVAGADSAAAGPGVSAVGAAAADADASAPDAADGAMGADASAGAKSAVAGAAAAVAGAAGAAAGAAGALGVAGAAGALGVAGAAGAAAVARGDKAAQADKAMRIDMAAPADKPVLTDKAVASDVAVAGDKAVHADKAVAGKVAPAKAAMVDVAAAAKPADTAAAAAPAGLAAPVTPKAGSVDAPPAVAERGVPLAPPVAPQAKPTFTASKPTEKAGPSFSASRLGPPATASRPASPAGSASSAPSAPSAPHTPTQPATPKPAPPYSAGRTVRRADPPTTPEPAYASAQYAGPNAPHHPGPPQGYPDLGQQYPPGTGGRPRRRVRRGRLVGLIIAAVVAAAAAGGGAALALHHGDTQATTTTNTANTATTKTEPQSVQALDNPANTAPGADWTPVTVSPFGNGTTGGFSIYMPSGWKESQARLRTYLKAPGGAAFMEIDLTPHTYPNMVKEADYVEQTSNVKNEFPEYNRASLTAVNVRGTPGAFWQFTFVPKGGTRLIRADDIFFIYRTSAGPQSYAIFFRAPDSGWNAKYLPVFKQMLHTFQTIPS